MMKFQGTLLMLLCCIQSILASSSYLSSPQEMERIIQSWRQYSRMLQTRGLTDTTDDTRIEQFFRIILPLMRLRDQRNRRSSSESEDKENTDWKPEAEIKIVHNKATHNKAKHNKIKHNKAKQL